MRINLTKEGFNALFGMEIPIDSILWLDKSSEEWEIKYTYPKYYGVNSFRYWLPNEDFEENWNQETERMLPEVISLLKAQRAKLVAFDWEGIPDGADHKIKRIKFFREKTGAGLKEAKDFVESGWQPTKLKAWNLPEGVQFADNLFEKWDSKVYVEDWGILPEELLNQVEDLLDYQAPLTEGDFQAWSYYLKTSGNIVAFTNTLRLSYPADSEALYFSFYKKEEKAEFLSNLVSSQDLIGFYPTWETAHYVYMGFKKGVELGSQKVKERIQEYVTGFTPKFY